MTAYACAKVSVKGKRHWYKAVEQTGFVALSDDSAWIIRTNGDLYLQTGEALAQVQQQQEQQFTVTARSRCVSQRSFTGRDTSADVSCRCCVSMITHGQMFTKS